MNQRGGDGEGASGTGGGVCDAKSRGEAQSTALRRWAISMHGYAQIDPFGLGQSLYIGEPTSSSFGFFEVADFRHLWRDVEVAQRSGQSLCIYLIQR